MQLTSKQVYDDQIKLKRESETEKRENSSEKHGEKRRLDLSTNETKFNSIDEWR